MTVQVLYTESTGYVTICVTPYIAWQGHISEVPKEYEHFLYVGIEDKKIAS